MTEPVALSHFRQRLAWDDLDESALRNLIRLAAEEDLNGVGLKAQPSRKGDQTTKALGISGIGSAAIVARESVVVCGLALVPLVLEVFEVKDASVRNTKADGDEAEADETLAVVRGSASALLAAERTLLNFLQRLCGIAAAAKAFVDALTGTATALLDTRKTIPGFRALEKYASATGGFYNHRYGLHDRILIKDNHLAARGATAGESLAKTVAGAKTTYPDLLVEVEVDHIGQIPPVLEAGADALLLDNFSPEQVAKAVLEIGNQAVVEASGGITLKTAERYAEAGPHFLSTGAPIHKSSWADLSLEWKEG